MEIMSARERYIMGAALTAWTVMAQLYVTPTSWRTGISPAALLDPESESAPAAIVEQRELFPRFMNNLVVPFLLENGLD